MGFFMDLILMAILIAAGTFLLNAKEQGRRIATLATYLRPYQIERLMESLTDGYLRALGESDPARRDQVWALQRGTETQLSEQFSRFAVDFAQVDTAAARVSRLALPLPLADKLFPAATFDMRKALAIHAQGIAQGARQMAEHPTSDHAFTLSAELFLMQHTCHWFCKSRAIATARMLARHQTPHEQLIASVSPATRKAYLALIQPPR